MTVPRADEHRRALKEALKQVHQGNASHELIGARDNGIFPDARVSPVPVLVLDANVLRQEVAYSCHNPERLTTLLNIANAGFVRLLCARHVVKEVVEEHAAEWSLESKLPEDAIRRRWLTHYAPLVHVVADLPRDLLAADEAGRISELDVRDHDDVPSAILAIAARAHLLSEDHNALNAVYGLVRDRKLPLEWRDSLRNTGDLGLLSSMSQATISLVELGGRGLFALARSLPTWLQTILLVGGAAATTYQFINLTDDRKAQWRELGVAATAMAGEFNDALAGLRKTVPPRASWIDLGQEIDPNALLLRACLETFASAQVTALTAEQLTRRLPRLPVACGVAKVRNSLRSSDSFIEVAPGRWQLGSADLSVRY